MRSHRQLLSVVPLLLMAACIEPYYPPSENSTTLGFLVVDGYLDGVSKIGTVNLSRSVTLQDYRPGPAEAGAEVTVEDESGGTFKLTEAKNGSYAASNLDLNASDRYRLHVETKSGSSYTSEFIQLRQSPSFDTLYWKPDQDGISFYVGGHDASNNTRYYRYLFNETWEYRSQFVSHYKNVGGLPVPRKSNEFVVFCWDSRKAAPIFLKSTTSLARDLVTPFPILSIKKGSRKLAMTYSLLVEQRAVSQEEYQFWDLIRKTNESMGGLFDPIPSQVLSNVRNNDNDQEPVLGYFGGGYAKQKRIFISFDDLPEYLMEIDNLSFGCGIGDYTVGGDQPLGDRIFVEVHVPSTNLYFVSSPNCADCRSLGGDTIKPNYWPQ